MKIQEIRNDLANLGLTENIDLATLIYLAGIMRKTPYKISVLVNGPAGLGKSHLAKRVLKLSPKDSIITSSRMTPAGLMECGDLSEKILFIYEVFPDPQVAQYMRELITEGEVIYQTANGEKRLKGPVTLIQTTVNIDTIGAENRSRCFVVGINSSDDAKSGICEKVKEARTIAGLAAQESDKDLIEKHQQFQDRLNSSIWVIIPYAQKVKFKASAYHAPRILHRIFNVIAAIAFLEQEDRQIKTSGDHQYIEATEGDFDEAKRLLTGLEIDEEESLLPRNVIEFAEILRTERVRLGQGPFTHKSIVDVLDSHCRSLTSKVISKYLRVLGSVGFIDELPVRGTKNSVRYQFSKDFPRTSLIDAPVNCYTTLSLL